jgi:hypothetical protein
MKKELHKNRDLERQNEAQDPFEYGRILLNFAYSGINAFESAINFVKTIINLIESTPQGQGTWFLKLQPPQPL